MHGGKPLIPALNSAAPPLGNDLYKCIALSPSDVIAQIDAYFIWSIA